MLNFKNIFGCSLAPSTNSFAFQNINTLDIYLRENLQTVFSLRPDGLQARVTKKAGTAHFSKITVLNSGDTISEFDVENLSHECILGANSPRYYSPNYDYSKLDTNILYISSKEVSDTAISPEGNLIDNVIIECDIQGNVLWRWSSYEHFKDFNFDEDRINAIKQMTIIPIFGQGNDWIHLNSVCSLGDNPWYKDGDERFHPDNLIVSSRNLSFVFIIEKSTGSIVYQLKGEDFNFKNQHYAHIIPEGLEGHGNILLFDGFAEDGKIPQILELNPVTRDIVVKVVENFGSMTMGSVQKLPNGEYLVCSPQQACAMSIKKDGTVSDKLSTYGTNPYRINWYPIDWINMFKNSL